MYVYTHSSRWPGSAKFALPRRIPHLTFMRCLYRSQFLMHNVGSGNVTCRPSGQGCKVTPPCFARSVHQGKYTLPFSSPQTAPSGLSASEKVELEPRDNSHTTKLKLSQDLMKEDISRPPVDSELIDGKLNNCVWMVKTSSIVKL